MTPQEVVSLGRESLYVALLLSAPMLGFGLVAGVLVSIFQAVTSINEMTLTFIPKIIVVIVAVVVFAPWILKVMLTFTIELMNSIPLIAH